MNIALVHDHFDVEHLAEVKAEMTVLGAPVIKAVWMECYNLYAALEGCHRIRAAKELGLVPIIDEVEYSDELFYGDDCEYAISEIADSANKSTIIEF
ncbi:MAG: hypothetical protein C0436_00340 [Alphaproteobacteria bacterium]|nr:hypothetical protein [Alphaproteobacteria bacterium]